MTTLSDCEMLACNINESCPRANGERGPYTISRHAIARIFGISEHMPCPHPGTMDVIARYLDYDNAGQMCRALGDGQDEPMFIPVDYLDSANLNKGERIHIAYGSDSDLILTCLGDGRYIVNESVNSKLMKGDEVHVAFLARGFEMSVSKVVRNGSDIGAYRSAGSGGLTALEIV